MVTKRDLIVAVLSTFCLTATLFMIMPIESASDEPEYDPLADVWGPENVSDGVINMRDIGRLCSLFGSSGTPINWTKLLEDVESLESRVGALEDRLLNGTIIIPPTAFTPYADTTQFIKNTFELEGDGWFYATVQLPHGATITNVSACVRDITSGGYLEIILYIKNTTALVDSTMALLGTGVAETPGSGIVIFDDTIDYATIDNENCAYILSVGLNPMTSDIRLYWVQIEYEY